MSELNLLEATRAVFASALPPNEKLVALALLNHWSRGRDTFPGVNRLVAWTSLSRRSVLRAVQRLEQLGAIRIERAVGLANRYDLSPLAGLTGATQAPVPEGHQCQPDTPPVPEGHGGSATLAPDQCHTGTRSDPVSDPVSDPKKGSHSSAPRKRDSRSSRKKDPEQPSADSHLLKIHYVDEYKKHRGGGHEPEFENWGRAMQAFGKLCQRKGGLDGAKAIVSNALVNEFCQRINPWELVDDANKHLKPPKSRQRVAVQKGGTNEKQAQTWGKEGARQLLES